MFGKRKPQETAAPTTTATALKSDVSKTSGGISKILKGSWDICTGATGATWHTYTSAFNPKARGWIGAGLIASAIGYGAAQEEFGAPSLGDIYKAAKDTGCAMLPESMSPAFCTPKDEIGEIIRRAMPELANG